MTGCRFEPTGQPDTYRCSVCGRVHVSKFTAEQLHLVCQSGEPKTPRGNRAPASVPTAEAERLAELTGDQSIVKKAARYAKALATWAKAGFPTRTDEEVAAIVAVCQAATYTTKQDQTRYCYDHAGGRCTRCGCCINAATMAMRNKARMATEHCPRNLW